MTPDLKLEDSLLQPYVETMILIVHISALAVSIAYLVAIVKRVPLSFTIVHACVSVTLPFFCFDDAPMKVYLWLFWSDPSPHLFIKFDRIFDLVPHIFYMVWRIRLTQYLYLALLVNLLGFQSFLFSDIGPVFSVVDLK